MTGRRIFTALVLAVLLPAAHGAIDILRTTELRPWAPHWADLGNVAYPFKTVWADMLVINGTTNTGSFGGGGTNSPVTFTNTLTLAAGASAFCTNYGTVAGYYVLGIPAGATGATGATGSAGANGANGTNGAPGTNIYTATIFTNSVLASVQSILYSSNAYVFTGSNYIGSYSQLQDWWLVGGTAGAGGVSPGSNSVENLTVSTNGGATWFTVTTSPSNITNAVLVSVVGDSNSAPGALILYAVDHPELVNRTNAFFGQHFQFDNPVAPADAVTLSFLQGYAVSVLASNVTLPNGFALTDTAAGGTNHLTFANAGNLLLDLSSVNNFIPIRSIQLTNANNTNVLLTVWTTNWTAAAYTETALTSLNSPIVWTAVTNATVTTNGSLVNILIPRILSATAQFYRGRLPAAPGVINGGTNIFTGNGGGLTNLALFAIKTNDIQYPGTFTNNIVGRVPWFTNAGVTYYLTVSTNKP